METKPQKQKMLEAHVFNFLRGYIPATNQDQNVLRNFLLKTFPNLLQEEPFSSLYVGRELINPWRDIISYIDSQIPKMGKKELFHIEFFLEQKPHSKMLLRIKTKIKEIDNRRGLDDIHIIHINDDCDTIGNMFRCDTKKTSKLMALHSLFFLYDRYLKYPETQDIILGRIKHYEEHIAYLAEEFCEGKTLLKDSDLNPFQQVIREIRLKANALKN